jgi:hypothetical protein
MCKPKERAKSIQNRRVQRMTRTAFRNYESMQERTNEIVKELKLNKLISIIK